jgi:hypothetical protein
MTRPIALVVLLAFVLAACAPKPGDESKPAAKPSAAKGKKCPDPDNRDSKDPCSVAYVKRTPPRFSEDALK